MYTCVENNIHLMSMFLFFLVVDNNFIISLLIIKVVLYINICISGDLFIGQWVVRIIPSNIFAKLK